LELIEALRNDRRIDFTGVSYKSGHAIQFTG
jgi:hypothetical protein